MRTVAIESVVENYEPLTQAMEEINRTSHDEYGAKLNSIYGRLKSPVSSSQCPCFHRKVNFRSYNNGPA